MELMKKVFDSFSSIPHPGRGHIIEHQCDECFGLERDFRDQDWRTAEPSIVEANFEKLPLFIADAFQYFLPAFLIHSLRQPDREVTEYTLYSLAPGKNDDQARWNGRTGMFYTRQSRGDRGIPVLGGFVAGL